MFGWSKKEREKAAEKAAEEKAAAKQDWISHCTQAGFTIQQAEFLFELVTMMDDKIKIARQAQFGQSFAMGLSAGRASAAGSIR